MPPSVKVTAPFRKLIQQLASAFYSGDCPPKTPEELAIAAQPKKSKAKVWRLRTHHGTFVQHLEALSSLPILQQGTLANSGPVAQHA